MSRLEVPIIGKTLRATGDTLPRAELKLLLRDRSDIWKPATFRVDPGTDAGSDRRHQPDSTLF
jgi:hypothetical protein